MKQLIASGLLLVSFSAAALAQNNNEQAQPAPVAGETQLGVSTISLDWVAVGYRASKLLKSDVYNDKSKKIGKVEDLIVKPDGTINVAILDVGGFLGINAHRVAIPVSQLTMEKAKIVLPGGSKEALKALPEFKFAKEGVM